MWAREATPSIRKRGPSVVSCGLAVSFPSKMRVRSSPGLAGLHLGGLAEVGDEPLSLLLPCAGPQS